MRGIDPRAFRMQSGRSTTELHPQHIHLLTEAVSLIESASSELFKTSESP